MSSAAENPALASRPQNAAHAWVVWVFGFCFVVLRGCVLVGLRGFPFGALRGLCLAGLRGLNLSIAELVFVSFCRVRRATLSPAANSL